MCRIVGNGYEISGKARSDTIVTAVSVSGSRRNHKWPNYVGKEGVGPQSRCQPPTVAAVTAVCATVLCM